MADRNGINQKVIAETLRDIARYIADKNVGKAHNKLTQSWLTKNKPSADEISHISQLITGWESAHTSGVGLEKYNAPSGQYMKSHYDVETSRWTREYGYPNLIEAVNDDVFSYFLKQDIESNHDRDPQNYWPGKLVPTLIEIKTLLEFCAYREELEGAVPVAQGLIDRIDDFKGFYGRCHCAGTPISHEQRDFINNTRRHVLEQYIEPNEVYIDETNCVNYAYNWLDRKWMPEADGTIQARLNISGNGSTRLSKDEEIAIYKASIAEGLRRGDLNTDVRVEYGKTYGDDAIVVTLDKEEYAKYVEIKRGIRAVDLSPSEARREWGDIMGPSTSTTYFGYEVGKSAFYGPKGVYVLTAAIDSAKKELAKDIAWIRETGLVSEEEIILVSNNMFQPFPILDFSGTLGKEEPTIVGGRYWGSCDLHNEINRKLRKITATVAGLKTHTKQTPKTPLASIWFEHAGKVFAPYNKAFEQAAFHFNAVSGLHYGRMSTVRSETLEVLDGTGNMSLFHKSHEGNKQFDVIRDYVDKNNLYVFHVDSLPEEQASKVKQDLTNALDDIKTDIESGGTGIGVKSVKPTFR